MRDKLELGDNFSLREVEKLQFVKAVTHFTGS